MIVCLPACASPVTLTSPVAETLMNDTIQGQVLDAEGLPVASARVRIQATENLTLSDAQGRFTLSGSTPGQAARVSAWKAGYYCALLEDVVAPAQGLKINLRRYQSDDNPAYAWIAPTGENSCYSCKPGVTQVWLDSDAHGRSAQNPRFLSMYLGSDVQGNQSPPTRYAASQDYGRFPLRPDPSLPYYGPGYKLDFPETAGNCAACHTPSSAVNDPYGVDPSRAAGVDAAGVHCDFCHKIADVKLDASGMPFANMPGVLSMDIRRPFPEDKQRYQLFFGPFDDDNVPAEDTYLPLVQESAFCAPCHFGVFWDTLVYNSYGEWLASPYSLPQTGKTCQACHMPRPTILDGEALTNVAPGKGGVERDPLTIVAHTFPGAASRELLQNAVTMQAAGQRVDGKLVVTVTITNDLTGHHVPTDSPLRHLILLVEAQDASGQPLEYLAGPRVPEWGGLGDPSQGNYAGLPGKTYAKILVELWTEISPSGAYWNPTRVLSDNRLAAYASDTSAYTFAAPAEGQVKVGVRLLFRRAFKALAEQKGWTDADILMEEAALEY